MERTRKSPESFLPTPDAYWRDKAEQHGPGGGLLAFALLMVVVLSVL
jgi:hypothetical protein